MSRYRRFGREARSAGGTFTAHSVSQDTGSSQAASVSRSVAWSSQTLLASFHFAEALAVGTTPRLTAVLD
jgi:hypothetical protein